MRKKLWLCLPLAVLAVILFILYAKGSTPQDPDYLLCKQYLGGAITYDEWSQMQPNPLLIGYKWKVHSEVETIVPGYTDEKMTADGEFEISAAPYKYFPCIPCLIGKYDAKIDWKVGPKPYYYGQVFSGTVSDSGEIDGGAGSNYMVIFFNGIKKIEKYTSRSPWGNLEHEKDFHLISSPSHYMQYKDGEDTTSNPYFHHISKLKIQAECPVDLTAPSPLIVNVTATMPLVTPNHSLSGAQIKNLVSKRRTTLADNAGLTQVYISPKLNIETSGSNARFGSRKCVWADKIDVDISPTVTMYIASEYPVGSCNYNATLAHENEHINVVKKLLAKHAVRIKTELEKATIPNKNMTMVANNFISGDSQINVLLEQIAEPLIKDLEKEVEKEFARLDSPANYQQVRSQCPNW